MLYEILDFFRMPVAIALSVLLVVIIANMSIKTGSPTEKTKTFVKGNIVKSLAIVAVSTFVSNQILKAVNNSISSSQSSREFWGSNVYYY